jgi:Rod binding domain-containing protein
MKVEDSFLNMARNEVGKNRSQNLEREKAATDFEEIFAQHLVKELTKDSFKMSDNGGIMGQSSNIYRSFVTDALASELAAERKLGMADLVSRYWDQSSGPSEK